MKGAGILFVYGGEQVREGLRRLGLAFAQKQLYRIQFL